MEGVMWSRWASQREETNHQHIKIFCKLWPENQSIIFALDISVEEFRKNQGDLRTFSSLVFGDKNQNKYLWWEFGTSSAVFLAKTWSFIDPYQVFFVIKPNQSKHLRSIFICIIHNKVYFMTWYFPPEQVPSPACQTIILFRVLTVLLMTKDLFTSLRMRTCCLAAHTASKQL